MLKAFKNVGVFSLRLSLNLAAGLAILFFFIIGILVFLNGLPDDFRNSPLYVEASESWRYKIGEEYLQIPEDFGRVHYMESGDGFGSIYEHVKFTLDIESFELTKQEAGFEDQVIVDIRPKTFWRHQDQWTEKDQVLNARENECKDVAVSGQTYQLCQLAGDGPLFKETEYFSIKDTTGQHDPSVIKCTSRNLPAPGCEARAWIHEDIVVNYQYRKHHLPDAVEIDQRIQKLVSGFVDETSLDR